MRNSFLMEVSALLFILFSLLYGRLCVCECLCVLFLCCCCRSFLCFLSSFYFCVSICPIQISSQAHSCKLFRFKYLCTLRVQSVRCEQQWRHQLPSKFFSNSIFASPFLFLLFLFSSLLALFLVVNIAHSFSCEAFATNLICYC